MPELVETRRRRQRDMRPEPARPQVVPTPIRPQPVPQQLRPGLSRVRPTLRMEGVSYSEGRMRVDIEEADPLRIPPHQGPVLSGTSYAVELHPPYARVSTSAISGFRVDAAVSDEFYIGSADLNAPGRPPLHYDEALLMRQSPSSDRFVVYPLQQSSLSTKGGTPLGVSLEIGQDLEIPASRGPMRSGMGQSVTVFAPFVEMVSGDLDRGFSAGGAMSDSYYIGRVQVGNSVYQRAIVMQESPESDRYRVIPLQ